MKHCRPAVPLACVLLSTAVGCSTTTPSQRDQAGRFDKFFPAIQAANDELMARFNRGDKLGVAAMYTDDAMMLSDGGERYQGRAAIDRYWAGDPSAPARPAPKTPPHWTLHILSLEGTPEMPVQRGRSIIASEWEGTPKTSDVQFFVVWRRQPDGTYRIAVDAWWPTPAK